MKGKKYLKSVLAVGLFPGVLLLAGCTGTEPAPTTGTQSTGGIVPLIILVVLAVGMFYYLILRPTQQREKRRFKVLQELQKGDMVITAGGIYGQIESMDDDTVILKIESGATMRVVKGGVLNKVQEDKV